jgi:uncharacterized membrane protein YfcA
MEPTMVPALAVAMAVAIAAFVQNAMGFGYALTALAILPFWLDIRDASVVVSLSALIPLALGALAFRGAVDWRALRGALVAMAICVPAGVFLFANLPSDWLVRGTGAVILLIVLDGLLLRRARTIHTVSRWWSAVAGAVSGFLAGFTGIGGPPLIAYAVRQPWSPTQFKGYVVPLLLFQALIRAGGLVSADLVGWNALLYSALAIPFAYAGGHLGTIASREIDADRFRQIALIMLAVIAVGMITRDGG